MGIHYIHYSGVSQRFLRTQSLLNAAKISERNSFSYGDRCPRGVLSRVFAIAWALFGLVIVAILTGKVTTALTDYKYSETNMELYGAEVSNEPSVAGGNESAPLK